jgi:hypothetical protein
LRPGVENAGNKKAVKLKLYGFFGSSREDELVGRGNLNRHPISRKMLDKVWREIFVKYHLEYLGHLPILGWTVF